MIELAIASGLMAMVVMTTLASVGWDVYEMRNRESWCWTLILFLECVLMPNPYLGLVLAVFTVGLFQIGRAWYILRGIVIPTAGLAAFYIALAPHLGRWMIAPLLWACVIVGLALGVWGILGYLNPQRPYNLIAPKSWFGLWGIYEHGTGPHRHICGQGNALHLVSVSSLCLAATAGLIVMGQWWAAFALPVVIVPMVLTWMNQTNHLNEIELKFPGQSGLSLLTLLLGLCWLYKPLLAVGLLAFGVVAVVATLVMLKPWQQGHRWIDSGRLAYWKDSIQLVWWPAGWRKRLFGFGTSTWFLATLRMGEERKHPNVYTAAHNEFVQQLLEHGILGLAVLLAYVAEALWRTSQAGPDGGAVFLMGLMVCSVALVNFPWTFFHEYHPLKEKEESWYGSPPLNALCFVVAVMVESIH